MNSTNTLINTLQPLLDVLKIIISAAPILLAANSGPTSSGAVTDQISTRRNKAESKVKEYAALFLVIPSMISFYINKARKVSDILNQTKNNLTNTKNEIDKLQALTNALLKNFEEVDFTIKTNTISDPIKTEVGYHLLEVFILILQAKLYLRL